MGKQAEQLEGTKLMRPAPMSDDVWQQLRDVVVRSVAISATVLAIDWVASNISNVISSIADILKVATTLTQILSISSPIPSISIPIPSISIPIPSISIPSIPIPGLEALQRVSEGQRSALVLSLLGSLSSLAVLLLALTSFAVTGLSAYGNQAWLLLYRWYQMAWWERLYLVVGRTNPLYRSLVLAFGLVGSLALLAASHSLGFTRNEIPSLAVVFGLAGLLVGSLLSLTLLIVSLRRPSDVIRLTYLAGRDVLRRVQVIAKTSRRLTERRGSGFSTVYPSQFQEQEETKQCVYALTEVAIVSLQARQRLAAKEAAAALGELEKAASATTPPETWGSLIGLKEPNRDWLQELFVAAFESVVLEAIDLHYESVGLEGAARLELIGVRMATDESPLSHVSILQRVLRAYMNTIDMCIRANEFEVRDRLLGGLKKVVESAADDATLWNAAMQDELGNRIIEMLTWDIVVDNVPSLRATLSCMEQIGRVPCAVEDITRAVLNLGAMAFASRTYGTAAVLTDFAARTYDKDGSRLMAVARPGRDYRSAKASDYVTPDYFQLFFLVAAGRAKSFRRGAWSNKAFQAALRFSSGLEDRVLRGELTIQRMSDTVHYPPREVRRWLKCYREICRSRVRRSAAKKAGTRHVRHHK